MIYKVRGTTTISYGNDDMREIVFDKKVEVGGRAIDLFAISVENEGGDSASLMTAFSLESPTSGNAVRQTIAGPEETVTKFTVNEINHAVGFPHYYIRDSDYLFLIKSVEARREFLSIVSSDQITVCPLGDEQEKDSTFIRNKMLVTLPPVKSRKEVGYHYKL